MLHTTIIGEAELDKTAADLLKEAARFQRRVVSATGKAVRRVYFPTLLGMVSQFMPSGYAPVFSATVKATPSVRFSGASPGVTVRVSAPTGGPRGRAVDALERGVLRAPSFPSGRRSTWRWHAQRIRRGFASVPLKAIRPQIEREIDQELAAIARDVERG